MLERKILLILALVAALAVKSYSGTALAGLSGPFVSGQGIFEWVIWFKDKACSFDPGGGVLSYVEDMQLRHNNKVITRKNR